MEDPEEEDDDNYPVFSEHGDTTMGEYEVEHEVIVDQSDDDDLRRGINHQSYISQRILSYISQCILSYISQCIQRFIHYSLELILIILSAFFSYEDFFKSSISENPTYLHSIQFSVYCMNDEVYNVKCLVVDN